MNRQAMLARVNARSTPWDIVVIGGGATGVGVAVEPPTAASLCCCWSGGLRQSHLEPQHQAGPWRRPLSGTGQRVAGDGGAQGARPAAPERAAPGP